MFGDEPRHPLSLGCLHYLLGGLGTGNLDLLWALGGIALGALVQGLRAR